MARGFFILCLFLCSSAFISLSIIITSCFYFKSDQSPTSFIDTSFFLLQKLDAPSYAAHEPVTRLLMSSSSSNQLENVNATIALSTTVNRSSQLIHLSPQSLRAMAKRASRAFPLRNQTSSWCFPVKERPSHWRNGLFFVKTKKASSSTVAGAVLRIIHKQQNPKCQAFELEHRYGFEYRMRSLNQSFLFSIVRDPAKRSLSQVFYSFVSFQNMTPTDMNIMSALTTNRGVSFNFQLRYLSLTVKSHFDLASSCCGNNDNNKTDRRLFQRFVKRTLTSYDFILLAERMDESLVALSMILGVPVSDVLTTPSKISGASYQLFSHKPPPQQLQQRQSLQKNFNRCVLIQKPFMSPNVSEFLQSSDWRAMNYGDYLLHQAVNYSLDRTIRSLGKDEFKKRLQEYKRLQSAVADRCFAAAAGGDGGGHDSQVIFPCSANGTEQSERSEKSCYWRDFGCGYPCIDRTLQQLSSSYSSTS